ncbi:hypothetical protein OSB04_008798 [Centaurea solstitialis]|uniref:Uncharacterized protein n=1 Tax=Centaurea solstitialis TaxID=347529 RepID=A0AA38TMI2_9ASTR|nr:hypothetical protein OSB04_008798 [Centaurea solstitialis]
MTTTTPFDMKIASSTFSFPQVFKSSTTILDLKACALSRRHIASIRITSTPLRFRRMITKTMYDSSDTRTLPGLPIDLRGKRAFIAGIADNNGYGWAIAKSLAAAGAEILVGTWVPAFNIFETNLRRGIFDESRILPDGSLMNICKVYPLDAVYDTPQDVPQDEVAESVKEDFGSIDILVHSLANGPEVTKPLLETSRNGYLAAVSSSSYSFVSLLKHFAPLMNPCGASVSLTYIASERCIPRYGGGMSSAKAALESDTKVLAFEAGRRHGIRVNTISAGSLRSRAAKAIGAAVDEMIDYTLMNAPLQKELSAEEVGNAAAFLASPLASAITGTVLFKFVEMTTTTTTPVAMQITSTFSFPQVRKSSIAILDLKICVLSRRHISSTQLLLSKRITTTTLRFGRMTTKAMSDSNDTKPLPGLPIDLRGKRAFIAGIADDNGYGWAIAKSLAAAGAEILVGTWVPALNIFETSLQRGKFDESRVLPDGSLMNISKVYPLDAVYDTPEDVPQDVKLSRRYGGSSKWTIKEVAESVKEDFGSIDILVHSIANGSEMLIDRYTEDSNLLRGQGLYEYFRVQNIMYLKTKDTYRARYVGGMSSAKAALESDTKVLAFEAGRRHKIRVNAISAGPLRSRAAKATGIIDMLIDYTLMNAPLQKEFLAEEVGNTAAFLASPLASAITGTVLYVDNGLNVMGVAVDSPAFKDITIIPDNNK